MILQEMRQIIREDDGDGINSEVREFIENAYPQFADTLFAMAEKNSQVGPGLNKLHSEGEKAIEDYLDTMKDAWTVANKLKNKTQDLAMGIVDPLNLRSFFDD